MSSFLVTFLPFVLVAYLVSVALGMIKAQGRGVEAVNRFWIRTAGKLLSGALGLGARFLQCLARLISGWLC